MILLILLSPGPCLRAKGLNEEREGRYFFTETQEAHKKILTYHQLLKYIEVNGWISRNIAKIESKRPGHSGTEGQGRIKDNPEAPALPIGRMVVTSTETGNPLVEELG